MFSSHVYMQVWVLHSLCIPHPPHLPPKFSIHSVVFVFRHYYSVNWWPVSMYLAQLFRLLFPSFLLSNQRAKVNWATCSAPSWFFPLIFMAGVNEQAELILLYTMYITVLCLINFLFVCFVLRKAQRCITRALASHELSQCLGLQEMCPRSCKS